MYSLLIAAVISVATALILTPICRNLASRWGWLDHPDSKRKTHTTAVPRIGGVAIFIAYIGTFAALFLFHLRAGDMIRSNLDIVWKLFPPATLVFAIGLVDDLWDLRPWQKLVGEVLAAVLVFMSGVHLSNISGIQISVW